MLVSNPKDILRAFSEGHIGWREALRKLELAEYAELEALMQEYGFPLYRPPQEQMDARARTLDALLYDEGELG